MCKTYETLGAVDKNRPLFMGYLIIEKVPEGLKYKAFGPLKKIFQILKKVLAFKKT